MTTLKDFSRVFVVLALQMRVSDTDPAMIAAYYEALADQSLENLHAAAKFFAREEGRSFFPTSAEWRTQSARIYEQDIRKTLADPNINRHWTHECEHCEDTGWEILPDCPGDATCGRTFTHAAHSFTRMCPCRPTNRTYQRHHMPVVRR